MNRTLMFAAALLSITSAAQAQRVSQMAVAVPGYQRVVLLDTVVVWTEVEGPAAATYSAVRRSLDALKIPVALADSEHFFMYNAAIKMSRRIAGQPMTWAMKCGLDVTGIDFAQSSRMTMAIAVLVDTAANGRSRVGTAFTGGAQTLEGTARAPIPCTTTGALEQRIVEEAHLKPIHP